jgi:hypothetical protein
MTVNDIRLDFWQRNSAGTLADILSDGPIITTFGAWRLADTVALMNPCGQYCRAFLGSGHIAECSIPYAGE